MADRKLACKQGRPRQTRRPFLRTFRRELSFLLPISGPQLIDNICFDLLTMTPNTVVTVARASITSRSISDRSRTR
jgi:hypothetical protein